MRIVDCSTHFGHRAHDSLDVTLETLLGELQRHNVACAWAYSLRSVARLARDGNAEALDAAARHSQLVPVATVDARQYPECLEDVDRCLSAGLRLFRLFPHEQHWSLQSAPFEQIVQRLFGHAAALIVSAADGGSVGTIGRLTAGTDLNGTAAVMSTPGRVEVLVRL